MNESHAVIEEIKDSRFVTYGELLDLRKQVDELTELVFAQGKTIEGMQQLFIRAGEYRGKPRGRLPR